MRHLGMRQFVWLVTILATAPSLAADPMEGILTYYDPDVPGNYPILVRNDRFAVRIVPVDFGLPDSTWTIEGIWSKSVMSGRIRVALCEDDTTHPDWEHFPGDTISFLEYLDLDGETEDTTYLPAQIVRKDNRPVWVYYDYTIEGIPFAMSGTGPPFGRNLVRQESPPVWRADEADDWAVGLVVRYESALGVGPGIDSPDIPATFVLHQNYPNPFNPSTTLSFALARACRVTLTIHDLRGRLIRTLVSGEMEEGAHRVLWDGKDQREGKVPSGIYLFRLQAGREVETKKMLLVK